MNITLLANHAIANVGDHAILQETLRLLNQAFPTARITLVFNDPQPAQAAYPHYQVVASAVSIATTLDAQGNYILASRIKRMQLIGRLLWLTLLARLGLRRNHSSDAVDELLEAIAGADLVLGCGGGYVYSDPDEVFGWFTLVLMPFIMAHLLARRVILLPQSIGPLPNIRQRWLAAWVVRHAWLTIVREQISLRFLQSLRIDQHAIIGPDLAFGMPSAAQEQHPKLVEQFGIRALQPSMIVGITAINWAGQSYTFGAQNTYEAALIQAVNTLTAEGAAIIFFAQCTGPSAAEDDRRVAARIQAHATHPERIFLAPLLNPQELQSAYGEIDLLIGTRMHSVILASNQGTPAVAIGYLHKTAGILQDMGLQQRGLEIGTVTSEQILAAVQTILHEQPVDISAYLLHSHTFKAELREMLIKAVS